MINKISINHNLQYIGGFNIGKVQSASISGVTATSSCDVIKDIGTGDVTFQGTIYFQNFSSSSKNFWVRIVRNSQASNEEYIIETVSGTPSNPNYTYHNVKTAAYDGYSGGADSDTWQVTPPQGEKYYLLYSRM